MKMHVDSLERTGTIDSRYVFLVVEAVETMRRVAVGQLRQLGAERVLVAKDGTEALRILNSQTVHGVLAELDMPGMSGTELLCQVRAHERLHALPFLMTTARPDRACVQQAIQSGVTGVLLKPYSANQLVQRLQSALACKPRRALAAPASPLAAAGPEPAWPAAGQTAGSADRADIVRPLDAQQTLLLVDDTPANLLLLSELLKDEYRIVVANNGARAMEICCSNRAPDLVLLDVMMPDMDGFEVARRMRAHPAAETIPVIFVTAHASEQARDRGLALGAVDFITKPIDTNQLKQRMRNFMRFVQLRKDQQADYDHMVEVAQLRDEMEHASHQDIKAPLQGVLDLVQGLLAKNGLSAPDQQQLRQAQALAQQVLDVISQ